MRFSSPRYTLSLAVAAALLAPDGRTQTATPASGNQEATTLDAVIVSGTARFKGLAKRDASFSITTASPEQIQQAVPQSTADLLKIVPGVWAEPSGGGTGANIFVRGMPSEGDAPFVTMQLDGAPLFPPPTLSFLENSTLFRVDDTVERMEVLRGGSSPIFSNGQPGLTVNFIQKKGQDEPEGSVRLTGGNNALRRIDVALDDGRQATRQGFTSTAFLNLRAKYDGENIAAFVADEWELSERLRLDLGARYERQSVTGDVHDTTAVDLDGNPATLYDNATSLALATTRRIDQDDEAFSWTAGLNFTLDQNNSLFARVNSGVKFPGFDNLRDGQDRVQDVDQYELGLKSGTSVYDLYLTAFYNTFKNSPFQAFLANGENFTAVGDSRARGLEVEGAIRPFGGFELAGTGVWLDAKYRNYREFTGNQVMRQPKRQFRITPSYYWMLPFGDLKVFATYSYIGERFADLANSQRLPSYDMLDVGANLHVGEHWEVTASGSNVTDTLGLTEGNVRVPGAATGGVFMGRPIAGRQYQMSVAYRW
ncbi:TonB-dependent receptor [Xanthomonas citri pv. anacardii]|nr:TonB-dependent receptor [Xanthomonas citri]MCT8363806.1 TonB-dependent receptor [Xanthomonas citri pv. anacardii]